MARYINRKCPKCGDYFGVVVNQRPHKNGEHPIKGFCSVCGYQLRGWRLILGRKRPAEVYRSRMPKVFRQ
jgi:C4-type Zn-finger protein